MFTKGRTMVKNRYWDAEMSVIAHRQMCQATLRALDNEFDREKAARFSRAAGLLAGNEFAHEFLDLKSDFRTFAASLQKALVDLKINTLWVEAFNPDTVIVGEKAIGSDGLPATCENIRAYDAGFVDGILEAYTGRRCNG